MITAALIYFVQSVIAGVLTIFPSADALPTGISSAFTTAGTYIAMANALFPVQDLAAAVAFIVALEITIWAVKMIVVIAGFVRGGH